MATLHLSLQYKNRKMNVGEQLAVFTHIGVAKYFFENASESLWPSVSGMGRNIQEGSGGGLSLCFSLHNI